MVMRVHAHGPQVLADHELVALILRAGKAAGVHRAQSMLRECGGLSGLLTAKPEYLIGDGIGPVRLAALLAAREFACRLARKEVPERQPLGRPAAVASYVRLRYALRDQEVMGALFLDVRHRLLFDRELYRGTLSRTSVEPREILKSALLGGAAAVVLFHTHPSGDPSPSLEDLAFTRRLAQAGETVGVSLRDHLVVGNTGRWVSLKERGVC
jgi:DNA repair protein RadC